MADYDLSAPGADDDDELTEAESMLFAGMLDAAGGDVERAILLYSQYEDGMAEHHGAATQEPSAAAWLEARPEILSDMGGFKHFFNAADGDLDRAEQLWRASEDKLAEARIHESIGTPRTYDEAFESWQDDRRAAVEPLKQDAARDPLGEAMNDFAAELHATNQVNRAARERVKQQETRGRG